MKKFVGLTSYRSAIFALTEDGDLFRLHFPDDIKFDVTVYVEFIQNIMPVMKEPDAQS